MDMDVDVAVDGDTSDLDIASRTTICIAKPVSDFIIYCPASDRKPGMWGVATQKDLTHKYFIPLLLCFFILFAWLWLGKTIFGVLSKMFGHLHYNRRIQYKSMPHAYFINGSRTDLTHSLLQSSSHFPRDLFIVRNVKAFYLNELYFMW